MKDEAHEFLRQTSQERSLQGGDRGDLGAIPLLTRGHRGSGGKGFRAQGTSWSPLCTGARIEAGVRDGKGAPCPYSPILTFCLSFPVWNCSSLTACCYSELVLIYTLDHLAEKGGSV